MYGKQVLTQLQNNTTIPFTHYAWGKAPEKTEEVISYGILTENRIEKLVMGNWQKEEVLNFEIDVFCYTDTADENKAQVENVLDSLQIAYSMDDIMYEQQTGLVHLNWECNVVYGDGVSPLSTLYLHDLQTHLCAGYQSVQVQDANIIGENIKQGVTILGVEGEYEGEQLPAYEGEYEVTSSAQDDRQLETYNRSLYDNITIYKNETSESITPETTGYTFNVF